MKSLNVASRAGIRTRNILNTMHEWLSRLCGVNLAGNVVRTLPTRDTAIWPEDIFGGWGGASERGGGCIVIAE